MAEPTASVNVVVIGGTGGIGRGIVEVFTRARANVVVADLADPNPPNHTTAREAFVPVDVRDPHSITACRIQCETLLGHVDVLIYTAGVITVAEVVNLEVSEWDHVMGVNVRGAYLCARSFLPAMIARRTGLILNVASISGKHAEPTISHYVASKFALIGFTQALAKEVARHAVRANCICPGAVDTPMLGAVAGAWDTTVEELARQQLVPRAVTPIEIGQAARFLWDMPAITGQAINVDGGLVFH